jgi:pimeloyl-ACP methyl ester carboxylesterase
MHVAEAGDPNGEPLLMLHGWPQNWFAFRNLIPQLAQRYRVIVPDLRGWGLSEAPRDGYDKDQMTRDVIALVDALGLGGGPRLRLVGHDWGSLFGFKLCIERPELIDRYFVLGGFHPWPKIGPRGAWPFRRFWYQAVVATPRLGPAAVANPRFIRLLYKRWSVPGRNDIWTDGELEALTGHLTEPARANASSLVYRHWLTTELPRVIAGADRDQTVMTPVLWLHGAQDRCIDPAYVHPTRHAPNMTIELLNDVGHFPAEEAPELVLGRARAFFA